jgi:hypothetical protein
MDKRYSGFVISDEGQRIIDQIDGSITSNLLFNVVPASLESMRNVSLAMHFHRLSRLFPTTRAVSAQLQPEMAYDSPTGADDPGELSRFVSNLRKVNSI